jgi:hypothetical protein
MSAMIARSEAQCPKGSEVPRLTRVALHRKARKRSAPASISDGCVYRIAVHRRKFRGYGEALARAACGPGIASRVATTRHGCRKRAAVDIAARLQRLWPERCAEAFRENATGAGPASRAEDNHKYAA